jgi:6-phosphogluconolactonase (cycloisomerase 2 family)
MQSSSLSDIWAFSVDTAAGTLNPVPGSPFHGETVVGVGGVNSIALDPTGKYLYASGNFSGITRYSVDSTTGALVELPASPLPTPGTSFNSKVIVEPSGKFLYVADFNNDGVWAFPINADGSLGAAVAGSPFASGAGPRDIALDRSGKFAFVPNEGDLNVVVMRIDSGNGALTVVDSADAGNGPSSVAVNSSGKFVYVTNYWDGTVSAYTMDAATGKLSGVAGSPFLAQDGAISVVTTK